MNLDINFFAVALAAVAQFVLGAFWYGQLLFGKQWMTMHDCDDLSQAEMKKMQKEMGPFYGLQFFITLVTTFVLALFIHALPMVSSFVIAGFIWLGFVVPTQTSAIIFGKDEKKYFLQKLAIMASNALVSIMLAAFILTLL